jgi:tRNA(Arg) A34 adenosine deaminase TadA
MKTNMKKKILKKVLEVCNKRLSKHSELDNFPHYSFVVKNGKIISWAKNSKVEPPLHYGYHRPWDEGYKPKYHAELAAYKKCPVKPPFEIINVRMNKQGLLRISKPCAVCARLMTTLGCRKFYYSFNNGFLEHVP